MDHFEEAAAYIRSRTAHRPTLGIVLGSGLGELADFLEDACVLPYHEIPHFSVSTAPGHMGRLVIGRLAGKTVCCMQGRLHYYEGHSMQAITFPIRVMRELGIETLFLSNAAGGVNADFAVGDLMLITDHINFLGNHPLIGENVARFGPRFNDMTHCYTAALQETFRKAAAQIGGKLQEGVYLATTGPSFETPAEVKLFRSWGASAVGMSTVPEAIVACHSGMRVAAVSCVTNMAAGITGQALSGEEVFETTQKAGERFRALILAAVALCDTAI